MTAPRLDRRRVLGAGARGGAALLLGGAALASCTQRRAPRPPDPLEPVVRRAAADARLATAVAMTHPALAEAATALATDREAHAAAVRAELRRVRPTPATGTTPATPSGRPPAPTDPTTARRELDDALRAAQDEAAALVGAAPGHRAGLLSSIAACCASHRAVLP